MYLPLFGQNVSGPTYLRVSVTFGTPKIPQLFNQGGIRKRVRRRLKRGPVISVIGMVATRRGLKTGLYPFPLFSFGRLHFGD